MKKYAGILIIFIGVTILVYSQLFGPPFKRPPTTPIAEPAEIQPKTSEEVTDSKKSRAKVFSKDEIFANCMNHLGSLPGPKPDLREIKVVCNQVEVLPNCLSHNSQPIFHYERLARDKTNEKRILAISLIHGDEAPSGTVARSWMQRLDRLDPRNRWRVIPISNPDGLLAKTRMNIKGVDLNRNFPTEDWMKEALKHWKVEKKSDPRKFPGEGPGSEPETQCLISHFKDFDPDFIISIHTPYGVLDFDGPRMSFPKFNPLPWISLGNYPGSLGRFMWVNKEVPVLTIELRGNEGLKQLEHFDRLQDISGTVAIQASKIIEMQNVDESKKN